MFVGPVPSVLQELVASEVGLLNALLGETFHHFGLGSDAGVVGSWHPKGVLAFLTRATHEDVLDSVVEHVAHVKHTGDVGWRYHDSVGFALIGNRLKQVVVNPVLIPFVLDRFRVVLSSQSVHIFAIKNVDYLFSSCKGTKKFSVFSFQFSVFSIQQRIDLF